MQSADSKVTAALFGVSKTSKSPSFTGNQFRWINIHAGSTKSLAIPRSSYPMNVPDAKLQEHRIEYTRNQNFLRYLLVYLCVYICCIQTRLNPENSCCLPLASILSSCCLHKNLKISLLKPTVTWYTNRFNIQQLYVLPTLYLCVLYLSENKQRLVPLTA